MTLVMVPLRSTECVARERALPSPGPTREVARPRRARPDRAEPRVVSRYEVEGRVDHVLSQVVGRQIAAVRGRHEPRGIDLPNSVSQVFQVLDADEPRVTNVALVRQIEIPVRPRFEGRPQRLDGPPVCF